MSLPWKALEKEQNDPMSLTSVENASGVANPSANKPQTTLPSVTIRFAGDSGDGMQLAGTQFTDTSALVGNDIETLNSLFWASPSTVRYGTRASELLYGHAAIADFRRQRGAVDQRRTLMNQRVTTFGRDFGVTNTEYRPAGSDRIGRQSQTWVRMESGWKIVSAHVSFGV